MKKLLLPLLSILLFTACQKEITTTKAQEEIAGATANKQTKMSVCHYDAVTGTYKTIIITDPMALSAHLKHGDVQGECSTVPTTIICTQSWMVKNLDVDTYRDGTLIPEAKTVEEWVAAGNEGTGAWCYYNFDPTYGAVYGKLYNWYAVNDPRGLAPTGWHVPSAAEWETLVVCFGGSGLAGGPMKSVGTIEDGTGLWYAPNTDATNSSGFTGLPGSYVTASGLFQRIGQVGFWWSSSSENPFGTGPYCRALIYNVNALGIGVNFEKSFGLSVRCLKD